jgi:hypothetical protein
MNPYRDSFDRVREATRHIAMAEDLSVGLRRMIGALPDDAWPHSRADVKAEARRILDELWEELEQASGIARELGCRVPPLAPARAFAQDAWRAATWQETIPDLASDAVAFMKAWFPVTSASRP